MKKGFLAALCLLVLSAPLFADMSKEELQRMYLDYLRSQNIRASVDGDGDIEFQYKGSHINETTFYIIVDETDQQYFRIVKYGIYYLDTEAKLRQAPLVAANVTRRADVAKIYINSAGTNLIATASAFIATPQDFMVIFPKLMRELDNIMYYFLNEMN
jgi:hypothetical protein